VFLEPQTARRDRLGADGYRAAVFHDLDGSVTGTQDTSVTIDTPLVAHGGCRSETQWRALVCPANFGSVFIVDVNARGRSPGPVHVALVENAAQQTVDPLHSLTLIGNPQLTPDAIFQANVRSSQTYRVSFERRFPPHLRLGLHHFAPGEHLTLVFPQAPRDLMLANQNPDVVVSHRDDGTLILDLLTASTHGHGATVIDLCSAGLCT
jgi:cell migration-inducing and hyaluronan-binding protein